MKSELMLGTEMGLEVPLVGVRGYRVPCELGGGCGQSQRKGCCSVVARNELTWSYCWLAGYRKETQMS